MENLERLNNFMQLPNKEAIEKADIAYIHSAARAELNKLAGHSVLLTGAGGFLGYYFIKTIARWNDAHPKGKIQLTALSSFRHGMPEHIREVAKRADIRIVKKDIVTYSLPTAQRFDYIIHAASIASPIFYRQYPIETINANVQGMYRILDYAVRRNTTRHKLRGLLYFSSSEIYGDPTPGNIPTSETYRGNVSCTGPRACYDESKRFCETLCVNYAAVHSLPIVVARPFNNYGPGLKIDDGRVIPDFARNILDNTDIVMYSNGSPSRTFCYVADALVGYIKILTRGRSGEAYNIGVEKPEITVSQLAQKMIVIGKKYFQYRGSLKIAKSRDTAYLTDNPERRCPRIAKAVKELGYAPSITLADGLVRTMMWYNDSYKK